MQKLVILFCFIGLVSCASVPTDAQLVADHTAADTRVADAIQTIGTITDHSADRLRAVQTVAATITDGLQRLAYLFEEYDREHQFLISEINRLRAKLETGEDNGGTYDGNLSYPDIGFDWYPDTGGSAVEQRD